MIKRDKKEGDKMKEKVYYNVDMNNGFVNFGAMANPSYLSLVPEQIKMFEKMLRENGQINFVLESHDQNAVEFKKYPIHCVKDTPEVELIDEFKKYEQMPGVRVFGKNSINGIFNYDLRRQIRELKALKEVIIEGVCADLCVMDFARGLSRYLDEINKEAKIFVVRNAIDTYDAPGHNRQEWLDIAEKVMTQAGIEYVDNIDELEEKEYQYRLTK